MWQRICSKKDGVMTEEMIWQLSTISSVCFLLFFKGQMEPLQLKQSFPRGLNDSFNHVGFIPRK